MRLYGQLRQLEFLYAINCESNIRNIHKRICLKTIFQRSRVWFLGANLQWGIIDYPKLQLKRELIFGLSDVLGMANIIINAKTCKYPLMF